MDLTQRLLIRPPHGTSNELATAAQDQGAWALLDRTRGPLPQEPSELEAERLALRVTLDDDPTPRAGLAILSTWSLPAEDAPRLRDAIRAWHDAGVPVAVEVRSREEGRRAVDAGADLLVARGGEGPGRVSPRSNLVLLPDLAELDVPLIAWGGAGPHATAALLVHADLVVLDAQLHLLPEAQLPQAWRDALDAFDGTDVRALGTTLEEPVNVFARIADEHVHAAWEAERTSDAAPRSRRRAIRRRLRDDRSTWGDAPGKGLHPLGHDAVHASWFARFPSLGAALDALEARVTEQLDTFPLHEGSPLAEHHGTALPVVQGAMANVSEVPRFARAVSDAGALPFLAFAALRPDDAADVMEGTLDAMGDAPFGCGIIGLDLNAEKRNAHMRLIEEHQPHLALVAAGTAEQALELEDAGVDTYLHTPSPGLVRQAVDAGVDHVVLEGNECGGHIGKLPSLVLWDVGLCSLEEREGVHVLLAGGIGDDASAAMAGTLAAGAQGVHPGILMGTAYLSTREAVETGAVHEEYQDLVQSTSTTAVTGDTVGIRSRSAPTPFTERLDEVERTLLEDTDDPRERRERFEEENLGATRVAARGLQRGPDGTYHEVDRTTRLQEGNYLMGQVAERLADRTTIPELHHEVTEEAGERVAEARRRLNTPFAPGAGSAPDERGVAVVGLGCVLPDAPDVATFWSHVLEGHVSVREIPDDRWPVPPEVHLDPDDPEASDTLLGAFVEDFQFDSIQHRIPPKVAEQMDPTQTWTIDAVGEALEDAGLTEVEDRTRWGVVLGNAMGGERRVWSQRRLAHREVLDALERGGASQATREEAARILGDLSDGHPGITEDTMPGELSNVIAGRVCNVFDLGGPARTVDAACASSLAAVDEAVHLLRDGSADVVVTGGVDRSMAPDTYAKFSAIGALSTDGSFPFDERASGFVMGEGCGVLVLKRLRDALEDGDHVYAVLSGVGSSSDGRGKGITAPNPSGQARAIQAALDDAGWDAASLDLVEAHGTGTPVGDPAEVETLSRILAGAPPGSVGLGSVKSNLGHLKAAAGAAGLIKTVLAIHHGVQPPTVVEEPTRAVDWDTLPLRLVTDAEPWTGTRRRAGVSAFGFGGTNSHVLLEAPPASDASTPSVRLVTGANRDAVEHALDDPDAARAPTPTDPVRVALDTRDDLPLDAARRVLHGDLPADLAVSKGVALGEGTPGKVAFVFPGQGSQYPRMALELAREFPAAREVLEEADQVLLPLLGERLTDVLAREGEEGAAALQPTEVCQPAVLAADVAVLRVLEEHGVEPDVVAGHSLGEYAALVAADVLSLEDALHLVSARGREMADVEVEDPGGLVATLAGPSDIEPLLEGLDAWPANLNAPNQTVVAGTTPALDALRERCEDAGIKARRLPVSAAFHSPIVEPATEPMRRLLDRVPFDEPQVPVVANVTAEPYPEDPDAARDLLGRQIASPVRWTETMAHLREQGVDLVVEVGPKTVLTSLARSNLPDVPAAPTLDPGRERDQFHRALLRLTAHGDIDPHLVSAPRTREGPQEPGTEPVEPRSKAQAKQRPGPASAVTPVVTGVALGVPGREDPFGPDAEEALLQGSSDLVEPVDRALRERMARMDVTRLEKTGDTGPRFVPVDDPEDVVQLSGRLHPADLEAYDADEDWLRHADPTARAGVAAALEALDDARIPLTREQRTTSTGTTLQGSWVLPEPLQGDTGVILASAFPGDASLVDAVQQRAPRGGTPSSVLLDAVQRLAPHMDDPAAQSTLLDWVTEHHASPNGHDAPSSDGEGFPRDLLFRVLGMGHAQIAQLLAAKGPNLHVNAACASTTAALAVAHDWIRTGRCKRVIVVGADVAGNPELLPWIGSGFLSAGAATTAANVEDAARPFDQGRDGMIVGSGAVALVVEHPDEADARGITPRAELHGVHTANSAYHGARIDPDHVAQETRRFLKGVQRDLDLDAAELARDLVFVSHEPATPARGGSAQAEVHALREALGDVASEVLVTNTKGLTGHPMGAGLEDGMAVRILERGQAPPVANLRDPDPGFQDLTFSRGGATDRRYALRFAAGFGSQVAMALFRRPPGEPGALDEDAFQAWLEDAMAPGARVETRHRLLRALLPEDDTTPATTTAAEPAPQAQATPNATEPGDADPEPEPEHEPEPAPATPAPQAGSRTDEVLEVLVELVSERTGYPEDVVEPDMQLEADLGVDTVKQAEILAGTRERFDIPPIEGLTLADVPTLRDAATTLATHLEGETGTETAPEMETDAGAGEEAQPREGEPHDDPSLEPLLVRLVSERTGYPEDVIEPSMHLEADLGVDTVKQAEILAQARETLGIPPIEGLSLADVPTIEEAARTLAKHQPDTSPDTPVDDHDAPQAAPEEDAVEPRQGPRPLRPTWAPADPAPVEPRPVHVTGFGDAPEGLRDALQELEAELSEEAELHVVPVPTPAEDEDPVEHLTELLVALRDDDARELVLLGAADAWTSRGLPALARTLQEEGRNARAVVAGSVPPATLAREVLRRTDASIRLEGPDRLRPALAPAREPNASTLPDDAVVLATGGLGAAVWPALRELARTRSVRIAVLGRTPPEDPGLDPDDEDAVQALRETLLDEARQGDGDVTPARVEAKLQQQVKRARRAHAYQALDDVAEVTFLSADARSPSDLDAAVDEVTTRWRAPDLVVHGAGVDRSRLLQRKDRDELHAVVETKLRPVHHLTHALPDAHHVAYGSIAGVLGNPGQADYALANGCLPGLLDPVDGTVIHWTAWDAAGGMADDDTVRQVLEKRNVTFLDPTDGAELFVERFATPGTVLVADQDPEPLPTPTAEGFQVELPGDAAWVRDHALDGRPLLAGVRHLQTLHAATRHAGEDTAMYRDVRFEAPLWIDGPTTVQVRSVDDELQLTRGDRVLSRAMPTDPAPTPSTGATRPDLEPDPLDPYQDLFHGPTFQVLDAVELTEDRARADARLDTGGAAPWGLALEAGFQAAGLTEHRHRGHDVLPRGVGELRRLGPLDAEARVEARLVHRDLAGSTWDVTAWSEGEVRLTAEAVRLDRTRAARELSNLLSTLGRGTGCTLRLERVPPHDPRDPEGKREAEHGAGRRAAADALRPVHDGTPPNIETRDGRPVVPDAPGGVSITHAQGFAVAAATVATPHVGVDLERVEPRGDAWIAEFTTEAEREAVEAAGDPAGHATVLWALKEAAFKTGLAGDAPRLRAIEVHDVGDGTARLTHEGEELEVEARWARAGEAVVALVRGPSAGAAERNA